VGKVCEYYYYHALCFEFPKDVGEQKWEVRSVFFSLSGRCSLHLLRGGQISLSGKPRKKLLRKKKKKSSGKSVLTRLLTENYKSFRTEVFTLLSVLTLFTFLILLSKTNSIPNIHPGKQSLEDLSNLSISDLKNALINTDPTLKRLKEYLNERNIPINVNQTSTLDKFILPNIEPTIAQILENSTIKLQNIYTTSEPTTVTSTTSPETQNSIQAIKHSLEGLLIFAEQNKQNPPNNSNK